MVSPVSSHYWIKGFFPLSGKWQLGKKEASGNWLVLILLFLFLKVLLPLSYPWWNFGQSGSGRMRNVLLCANSEALIKSPLILSRNLSYVLSQHHNHQALERRDSSASVLEVLPRWWNGDWKLDCIPKKGPPTHRLLKPQDLKRP